MTTGEYTTLEDCMHDCRWICVTLVDYIYAMRDVRIGYVGMVNAAWRFGWGARTENSAQLVR